MLFSVLYQCLKIFKYIYIYIYTYNYDKIKAEKCIYVAH